MLVVIARLLVQLATQILLGVLRPINGRLKESLDHVQERCCPLLLTFIIIATSHAFPTFLFPRFFNGGKGNAAVNNVCSSWLTELPSNAIWGRVSLNTDRIRPI